MRILIHDPLKLLPRGFRPFLGGGEAGNVGLRGRSRGPKLSLQSPHRLRHVEAGLLILRAPVSGLLGSSDGDAAELILFELMAGFCAHDDLPVSVLSLCLGGTN